MLTLTHKTTRERLESSSKAELIAALTAAGTLNSRGMNPNLFKKAELVDVAASEVSNIAAEHAKKEADAKAVHDAVLKAEAADPVKTEIKKAILKGLLVIHENLAKTFAEFRAKTTNDADLAYRLEWDAENIFKADAMIRESATLRGFVADEIDSPKLTFAEFVAALESEASRKTERALGWSVSHSTSPAANVRNEAEADAIRWMARLLPKLLYAIKKDLEANAVVYTRTSIWS